MPPPLSAIAAGEASIAGEGFIFSLCSSLVFQPALAELPLLQVHVLDASRSSYPVRRSAAGIAVDADPLLRFPFQSRCRFWFCASR
jgi:hypothetical protein